MCRTRTFTRRTDIARKSLFPRPWLEALEDRLVPASSILVAPGNVKALIAAINQADITVGGATIELAPNSTYDLTAVDNYWYGPNGLPPITNNVIIHGNGSTIVNSGPDYFRFFIVSGGSSLSGNANLPAGNLELDNLTLQGGTARGGSSGHGGGGLGAGGAIFNMGTLTLKGDTLFANNAIGGQSGVTVLGDGGGGQGESAQGNLGGGFGGGFSRRFPK